MIDQQEANQLLDMDKYCADQSQTIESLPSQKTVYDLTCSQKKEKFLLDVDRNSSKLTKATYQNRARRSIILVRLDIDGGPHKNPDGKFIKCPHIHIYREGFGDKWAFPVDNNLFGNLDDLTKAFEDFLKYCKIHKPRYSQLRFID